MTHHFHPGQRIEIINEAGDTLDRGKVTATKLHRFPGTQFAPLWEADIRVDGTTWNTRLPFARLRAEAAA